LFNQHYIKFISVFVLGCVISDYHEFSAVLPIQGTFFHVYSLSHPIQLWHHIDDDDDDDDDIVNCKWAVTRWQWLLCMYINMK